MHLPWSNTIDKVTKKMTLYFFLSAAAYIFFYHDFAPSKLVFWPSLLLSLAIGIPLIYFLFISLKKGTWMPPKEFSKYGFIKKIIIYPALPISLFFSVWLNFYYLAPRAITSIAGGQISRIDTAMAQVSYGRKNMCDYSIKLDTTKSFLLKICTNPVFYAHRHREKFQVTIHAKESILGLIVIAVEHAP